MTPDLGRITGQINHIWDSYAPALLVAAAAVALAGAVLATRAVLRRGAKQTIGFGLVQAGVTYAVIGGVYEFFAHTLGMPAAEAWILAIFIEASVWAAVGFIYTHGKGTDAAGRRNVGFGPAGPFFWVAQAAGGMLAVIGSPSTSIAVGRLVIVALGAYMWHLRLLQVTVRPERRGRWRWTPHRLLLAVGAIAPDDQDVEDEHREWQVRRLARALRWGNSRWPLSMLGAWMLTRRAEVAAEDVLAAARRRYAAAHVLREQSRVDSPAMAAVIAAAEAAMSTAGVTGQPQPAGVDTTGGHRPDTGGGHEAASAGRLGVDIDRTRAAVPRWTGVDTGHPAATAVQGTLPRGRAAVKGADMSTAGLTRRQRNVLSWLEDPSLRLTQREMAHKLRVSPKTVQRELAALRRRFGVDTDDDLRTLVTGQATPAGVDNRAYAAADIAVDTSAAEPSDPGGQLRVNGVDIGPAMAGQADRS